MLKTVLQPGRARAPLLALMLVGLAACISNTIEVTRRTSFPPAATGARFIVLLTDEQQGDPDIVHDASFLVARLEADGLVAANTSADARYAVMLARSRPSQHQEADSAASADDREANGFGGAGGHGMGGGGFGGHHGGHGMGRGQSSPERGVLRIAMFDLTKPRSPKERVFYAEVHAPADRQASEDVVEAMIAAALKNFPGKSSESYSEPLPARSG